MFTRVGNCRSYYFTRVSLQYHCTVSHFNRLRLHSNILSNLVVQQLSELLLMSTMSIYSILMSIYSCNWLLWQKICPSCDHYTTAMCIGRTGTKCASKANLTASLTYTLETRNYDQLPNTGNICTFATRHKYCIPKMNHMSMSYYIKNRSINYEDDTHTHTHKSNKQHYHKKSCTLHSRNNA